MRHSVDTLIALTAALPSASQGAATVALIRDRLQVLDDDGSRGTHNHFEQMRILEESVEALKAMLQSSG